MGIIDLTVSCPFCEEWSMHLKSVNTMPVKKKYERLNVEESVEVTLQFICLECKEESIVSILDHGWTTTMSQPQSKP